MENLYGNLGDQCWSPNIFNQFPRTFMGSWVTNAGKMCWPQKQAGEAHCWSPLHPPTDPPALREGPCAGPLNRQTGTCIDCLMQNTLTMKLNMHALAAAQHADKQLQHALTAYCNTCIHWLLRYNMQTVNMLACCMLQKSNGHFLLDRALISSCR